MRDPGHEWTQERIDELEKRNRDSYQEAVDDIRMKMDAFIARFAAKNEELLKRLEAEKITEADYRDWLAGQVFQKKRWQATLEDLTDTLARANELAMQIINDAVSEAFAYNANWATYSIEKQLDARGYDLNVIAHKPGRTPELPSTASAGVRFGFGLYDRDTVTRLLRDEPNLLPPSRVDIPKDKQWNMGNITRQIMQGIVQGEKLEQVAQRLTKVADMNIDSARTHARTAMTGAQNAGRLASYRRTEEQTGFEVQQEWLATLDGYTREAHGKLDGQRRPPGEAFEVTHKGRKYKIMYPGDPTAAPCMVYNCRCTTIPYLPDFPPENAKRRDDDPERVPIKDMTFAEWMAAKSAGGGEKELDKVAIASPRFLNKGDLLYKNAAKVKPIPGYEDVAVHGDRYGFVFKDADGNESNVSVKEFADILRKSDMYHGGAVRLLSCETGAEDSITAQALADELGVEVMAPSGMLIVDSDGEMEIEPRGLTSEGKWVIFKPRKG